MLAAYAPIYTVKLVRSYNPLLPLNDFERTPKINNPRAVVDLLWRYLKDADREHFVALLLDVKGGLIGETGMD